MERNGNANTPVQAGETAQQFAQLLHPVMRPARRYALMMTRDRHDADDLLQDALASAWIKFGQLSDPLKFRQWLFAILRQEHWLRRRKAIRRSAMLQPETYDDERADMVPVADNARTRHGTRIDIRAVLARLRDSEREMLLLSALGGVTLLELSRLQACGLNCMKKRMERTRTRAQACFGSALHGRMFPGVRDIDPVAETMLLLDAIQPAEAGDARWHAAA